MVPNLALHCLQNNFRRMLNLGFYTRYIQIILFERKELEINYFLLAYISDRRLIGSVEYHDKIILAMGPLLNTIPI